MAIDDTRPLIHFTPHVGWMNDPLALTWHDGLYHLFFQYVPGRTTWAPECRWGHATSDDLVHWSEHSPILGPGDGDDGAWSGSLVIDPDTGPAIFYTSVTVPDFGVGRIRVARPRDSGWSEWVKGDVVVEATRSDLIAFRDPYVFRDADCWRMLVGTAIRGGVAAASSYSSSDLRIWRYDGLAAFRATSVNEPVWTGSLWECPQLFEIGGRHILITSVWDDDELHYVAYGVGRYADGRFSADSWHRLTYGDGYYAPSFFRDDEGRPCLIFWIRGVMDQDQERASALSVPHLLALDGDVLQLQPHPVLERRATSVITPTRLGSEQTWRITWPATEGHLTVGEGSEALILEMHTGHLSVSLGDAKVDLRTRGDSVTIIIDRQVVEIFTGSSVAAFGTEGVIQGLLRTSGHPVTSVRSLEYARSSQSRQVEAHAE
ncbi:glycoside hydrolase family 32 protein [Actinomyces provencensis]|uniref:glycoside hydrolase family 32 protein n=1 Tax=Actinomyces provencensis TaxID=1720198 RepID=UPI0018A86212|nr:glycoside hydrolase family 32 protein [Actinomyces provencensis]